MTASRALITGASSGIGLAFVTEVREEGRRLFERSRTGTIAARSRSSG
jgi:short-subunit dehydrogenase